MTRTLFGKLDEIAIERLKMFEPEEGYYVAYSGGKDSDVVLDLVRRAGVKYDAHHNLTTADPPEVVMHVREQPDVTIHRPERTMWQLIRDMGFAPTRYIRYCCATQKECGGVGRLVVTGVRWAESGRRSKRQMVESCWRDPSKRYLNLIIDWTDADVWSYIRQRRIKYCSLYDEGFTRIGCVLCPLAGDVEMERKRWPAIARAWERAIKAAYNKNPDKNPFDSAEEYWQWWLSRENRPQPIAKDECLFREDGEGL